MDKREHLGHLLIEAISKARQLKRLVLDSEARARVQELVKTAKKTAEKFQALNQASGGNGKGLDKAALDAALDELIEVFEDANKKLDGLLAKAK